MSMNKESNNTLSKSVMEKIETEQTKPRPRVYFTFKNILIWTTALVTVVLGSLIVSSIVFRLVNLDKVLPPRVYERAWQMTETLPFTLFVLFIIFGYLMYKQIRLTRSGYKYEMPVIFLSIGFVSLVFGILFYVVGVGYHVDRITAKGLPFHPGIEKLQSRQWTTSDEGVIVGEVVSIENENIFLRDRSGAIWNIPVEDLEDKEDVQTVRLFVGQRIGVVGVANTNDKTFKACDIRSLEFKKQGFQIEGERNFVEVRMYKCEGRTALQ